MHFWNIRSAFHKNIFSKRYIYKYPEGKIDQVSEIFSNLEKSKTPDEILKEAEKILAFTKKNWNKLLGIVSKKATLLKIRCHQIYKKLIKSCAKL